MRDDKRGGKDSLGVGSVPQYMKSEADFLQGGGEIAHETAKRIRESKSALHIRQT